MREIPKKELEKILAEHLLWLQGSGGEQANLRSADLSSADLSSANLSYADLSSADLRSANLRYADLSSANLSYADLRSANLRYANLRYADLSSANLRYADLSSADLSSADLSSANLSSANLSSANLRYANLSSANLRYADLNPIKHDVIVNILRLPNEISFLRNALASGKVNGSQYDGECACLAGTMAHACGLDDIEEFRSLGKMPIDAGSPREKWFLAIREGDTPENSSVAKLTMEWIDEALSLVSLIRGTP